VQFLAIKFKISQIHYLIVQKVAIFPEIYIIYIIPEKIFNF